MYKEEDAWLEFNELYEHNKKRINKLLREIMSEEYELEEYELRDDCGHWVEGKMRWCPQCQIVECPECQHEEC